MYYNKQILIFFFILIISIINCQSSESSSTSSYDSSDFITSSEEKEFINYIPYDENCQNQVNGVGFGLQSMTCLTNTSTGSIFTFDLEEVEYVNLTSSHWGYCSDPIYTQIFKVNQCAYYKYSQTTYNVFRSSVQPQIQSNTFLIQNYDSACINLLNYWYASNGTTVLDFKQNLSTIYYCKQGEPYVSECDSNGENCNSEMVSTSCDGSNLSTISCI